MRFDINISKAAKVIGWATITFVMLVVVMVVLGRLTNSYTVYNEQSGSMRPSIAPGDAVVMAPIPASELKPGMVIASIPPAPYPHEVVLHEVATEHNGIVTTRGTANKVNDPWHIKLAPTVWHEVLVIPYGGYISSMIGDNPFALMLLIAIIVLAFGAFYIRRELTITKNKEAEHYVPARQYIPEH